MELIEMMTSWPSPKPSGGAVHVMVLLPGFPSDSEVNVNCVAPAWTFASQLVSPFPLVTTGPSHTQALPAGGWGPLGVAEGMGDVGGGEG